MLVADVIAEVRPTEVDGRADLALVLARLLPPGEAGSRLLVEKRAG